MQCPVCGTENPANATFCVECGHDFSQAAQDQPTPPPVPGQTNLVPSYMIPAILVTFFCCVPLGIPAIVYASQVQTKLQAGDHHGAMEASKKARTWSIIALVSGLIVIPISVLFVLVGGSGGYYY